MKIIETIVERIDEEIHDAKTYAKLAAETKETIPALSHVFYSLSVQEAEHATMLHEQVVKVIEQYRRDHGSPPPAMLAVYEHHHKKSIEKMEEAKRYQEIYKEL